MTDVQRLIVAPTAADLTRRAIMEDAGGDAAKHKLAKRKLDQHGSIKSHCAIVNDPKRLKSLKNQQQLAASIAQIQRLEEANKVKTQENNLLEMRNLAPKAMLKLANKGGDVNKLTIKEIAAVLLVSHGIEMLKGKKNDYVKRLEGAITAADSGHSSVSLAVDLTPSGLGDGSVTSESDDD